MLQGMFAQRSALTESYHFPDFMDVHGNPGRSAALDHLDQPVTKHHAVFKVDPLSSTLMLMLNFSRLS